ncbi:MAG: hypothetical protein IPP05_03540 [Cytophagaceae bacterium]|nr:hypothetical protein [Cytophagaceae bacterium]MBL0303067.1 hypothetical protein [Cytophagaceae bacterium]
MFYFSIDFSLKPYSIIHNGDAFVQETEEWLLLTDRHFQDNYPEINIGKEFSAGNFSILKDLHVGFSIIFYSKKTHKLQVFRDLFGIKSIYFSLINDKICISDRIKSLQETGENNLDNKYIKAYLDFEISDQNINADTFFSNIKRVLPGHILTYEINNLKQEPNESLVHFEASNEDFLEVIKEKIKDFSLKFESVGTYLSGGLDSGLISILLNYESKKHTAFYFKTDSELTEDETLAEEIAENFGFPLKKISPPIVDIVILKDWASKSMQPELMLFPAEIFAKIINSGNEKVLLSGHGGDTIAGEGLEYLEIQFENRAFKSLKNSLFLYYSKKVASWEKIGKSETFQSFLSGYFLKKSLQIFQKNALWPALKLIFRLFQDFDLSVFDLFDRINLKSILSKLNKKSPTQFKGVDFASLFLKTGTRHQKSQLNSNFIGLGVHALETFGLIDELTNSRTLYPLLDARLLNISLFQSPLEKFSHGRGRGTIRQALEKVAPENLTNRTGKGDFDKLIEAIFKDLWESYGKLIPDNHEVWKYADKNIYNNVSGFDSDPIFTEKINKDDLWYVQRTMYLAIWLDVLGS